jgi:hypothetical protein
LKNCIVELYEEEIHRKPPSYDALFAALLAREIEDIHDYIKEDI